MDLAAVEADMRRAIGARKVTEDYVAPALVERLAVTLESEDSAPRAGVALPPTWHTIFCLQSPTRSELGEDGLPRRSTIQRSYCARTPVAEPNDSVAMIL